MSRIEIARRMVRLIRQAPTEDAATALLVESIDRTWPQGAPRPHPAATVERVGGTIREEPHPGEEAR